MTGYRFSVFAVSRSRGGSALEAAAYQMGSQLRDQNTAKLTRDYRDREGRVASFVLAPRGAPSWASDPSELWSRASAAETRKNSQEGRGIVLSFPRQLDAAAQKRLITDFAQAAFVESGMVAQVDMHRDAEGVNPHAHVLLTTRRLTPEGFSAHKERSWNRMVETWRPLWSAMAAKALYQAGHEREAVNYFYAHRTLEEQREKAIERGDRDFAEKLNHVPTRHEGPARSAQTKRDEEGASAAFRGAVERGDRAGAVMAVRGLAASGRASGGLLGGSPKARRGREARPGAFRQGSCGQDALMKAKRKDLQQAWDRGGGAQAFMAAAKKAGYQLVKGDRRPFCLVRFDKETETFFCHSLSSILRENGRKVRVDTLRATLSGMDGAIPSVQRWGAGQKFSAAEMSLLRRRKRPKHRRHRNHNGLATGRAGHEFGTKEQVRRTLELCRDPMRDLSGWNDYCQAGRKAVGVLSSGAGMDVARGEGDFDRMRPVRGAGGHQRVGGEGYRPILTKEVAAIQNYFRGKTPLMKLLAVQFKTPNLTWKPWRTDSRRVEEAMHATIARQAKTGSKERPWFEGAEAREARARYAAQHDAISQDRKLNDIDRTASVLELKRQETLEMQAIKERAKMKEAARRTQQRVEERGAAKEQAWERKKARGGGHRGRVGTKKPVL